MLGSHTENLIMRKRKEEEEEEVEEAEPASVSMTKQHKDIMDSLAKLFKNKFMFQEQEIPAAQRLFNINSSTLRLIFKPQILKGSLKARKTNC